MPSTVLLYVYEMMVFPIWKDAEAWEEGRRGHLLFILYPPILLKAFNIYVYYFYNKMILSRPILFHLCQVMKRS